MTDDARGQPRTANEFTDPGAAEWCQCVAQHNPNVIVPEEHHIQPLYLDGPDISDNRVWLCPTSHSSVHNLLSWWVKRGGQPEWEIRRHFSPYIRALAAQGWHAWNDAQP